MVWLQVALLAFAVSIDSLAVGAAYGLRRVKMPVHMVGLVAGISSMAKAAAMAFGAVLVVWICPELAQKIGALILIGLAIWQYLWAFIEWLHEKGDDDVVAVDADDLLLKLRVKPLGIIISVLKDPELADLDDSKSISPLEAVLLGAALGMDALAAGIGAGMLGMPVLITAAVVGIGTLVTLPSGVFLGSLLENRIPTTITRIIPGTIFLVLGVIVWLTV